MTVSVVSQQRISTPVRDVMRPGAVTIPADAPLLDGILVMPRGGVPTNTP